MTRDDTKPTAADMRTRALGHLRGLHSDYHHAWPNYEADLDALLAAARAEALEEADIAVSSRRYLSDWSRDARTSEDARKSIRALVKP